MVTAGDKGGVLSAGRGATRVHHKNLINMASAHADLSDMRQSEVLRIRIEDVKK